MKASPGTSPPYQYRQFRVLEFPGYRQFARAFPNTIPFSEAGFISDQRDETAVDFPFYVTAHEMAHQWWGHQVAGALMPGVQVLTETLAQYSALMVMEDYYGEAIMRRFLKHELDSYLASRRTETLEELPLIDSERQDYIHYDKGSLVMYALKDLIGEDRVNLALRRFLGRYAFAPPPYPTARDLLEQVRSVAGSEHQDMITDWFEKIVLYDLSVRDARSKPVEGGYEVELVVSARQLEADGQGVETEVPLSAYLDIGVFRRSDGSLSEVDLPPPLYLDKHLITSGEQTIVIRVAEEPARVGIDPYSKMIDRNPNDNLRAL